MKKRKPRLADLVPVGFDGKKEVRAVLIALGLSFLWSLRGPLAIAREMKHLRSRLLEGAVPYIVVFPGIIGTALFGFYLTALALAALAVWHYMSHRRGARSDYLMRRLPDRWEYHRRCLAVPLTGIALSLLLAAALWFGCRAYYLHMHRWAFSGTGMEY